jgi:hypothetical protein
VSPQQRARQPPALRTACSTLWILQLRALPCTYSESVQEQRPASAALPGCMQHSRVLPSDVCWQRLQRQLWLRAACSAQVVHASLHLCRVHPASAAAAAAAAAPRLMTLLLPRAWPLPSCCSVAAPPAATTCTPTPMMSRARLAAGGSTLAQKHAVTPYTCMQGSAFIQGCACKQGWPAVGRRQQGSRAVP